MKTLIVFAFALVCVHADGSQKTVEIVEQTYDQEPDGRQFKYAWETSDGSRVEANGHLEGDAEGNAGINIDGNVKYVDPNGTPVAWSFKAGAQGYVAEGEVIPTPPPSPPSVLRLLDYISKNLPPAGTYRK